MVMPQILFFVYFVFISILLCLRRYLWAAAVSAAGTAHILAAGAQAGLAPFLIVVFAVHTCFFFLKNVSAQAELRGIDSGIIRKEERLKELTDQNKVLKERNKRLENGLAETAAVYEYVKNLGSTMEFDEALVILRNVLFSLVRFRMGRIILIGADGTYTAYEMFSGTGRIGISGVRDYEKDIISRVRQDPQIFRYERDKTDMPGELHGDTGNVLILPLRAENNLAGVIILQDAEGGNTEKLRLISLQFAMEIKKTRLYKRIKELSTIDGLTQLNLRRHFMYLFGREIERAKRQGIPVSFFMIDIDCFKQYNDKYGHLTGDVILKKTAAILKERSREVDLLCRYGGDEFAVCLPGSGAEDAKGAAERHRRSINEFLFSSGGEQFQVSVSIGVSGRGTGCINADSNVCAVLIDEADKALYKAKSSGRNKVVLI